MANSNENARRLWIMVVIVVLSLIVSLGKYMKSIDCREGVNGYRPMVYVSGQIYAESSSEDSVVPKLPKGYEEIGQVKECVPNSKPQNNFESNDLEAGTPVYASSGEKGILYLKISRGDNKGKYIQYDKLD